MLWRSIFEQEKTPLPECIKVQDILKGEVDTLENVKDFFTYLIAGPDARSQLAPSKIRRVESLCQDAIYTATNGIKKPSKHLQLGLAVKSMTGSKKVIKILNR